MAFRLLILFVACFLVGLRPAGAVSPKEATGAAFVASDGKGEIRLVWFPPLGKWPLGGWQIQEAGSGRVLVQRVEMADPATLAVLDAKDVESVRSLPKALREVRRPEDAALVYGMAGAHAFADWDYAVALGLARAVRETGSGMRSYKVFGLDEHGRPATPVLQTPRVDPAVPTPLPPAPLGVNAEPVEGGISVAWKPPAMDRELPILAYAVERSAGNTFVPATETPLIRAGRKGAELPALVDRNAPLDTQLTYRVSSVDLFGRRSQPVGVELYAADLVALQPPLDFSAEAGRGQVSLRWRASGNPHTAGYVLERACLPGGPFEAVTPKGLRATESRWLDDQVSPGTAYYYRLRMMGPRGDLGPPSRAAMAQPMGKDRPGAIADLKADAGRTRVRLSWGAVQGAIAGYLVERKDSRGGSWLRLQGRPQPEPFYDDNLGETNGGSFSYRVVAVGYDSQESRPSNEVIVSLPDLVPPPAPHIVRIDGSDGRVHIVFAPGAVGDIDQFLVLRGETEAADLVVGDPLPATATRFEDSAVEPGKSYWYRLVAIDRAGNRSEPSVAIVVRVGSGEIPVPAKPAADYVADPFPHAVVRFGAPPSGFAAEVQYRFADQPWLVLAGPLLEAGEATQANLPVGSIRYRLVYRDAGGRPGQPSDEVVIDRR